MQWLEDEAANGGRGGEIWWFCWTINTRQNKWITQMTAFCYRLKSHAH